MSYAEQPNISIQSTPVEQVSEYHDRARWGPIIAGLVVALSTQLVLSAIGSALGLSTIAASDAPRSDADNVGTAVGIWTIASLFISLFAGGWMTARTCGPTTRKVAILNGAILWATTLTVGSYLLASGVSGALGTLGSNAGVAEQIQRGSTNLPERAPSLSADQTRNVAGNAAKAGWSFALGSLLGLGAAMFGASSGTQDPRDRKLASKA